MTGQSEQDGQTGQRWGRPAAGREPAAAALLAWLADAEAPRLCVVTGSAGCGKSTLLAWLIAHGRRPDTPPSRRVHAFAPLEGRTATTVAWTLAGQLSVAARTPGGLVDALARDTRRTLIVLPGLHASERPEDVTELILALLDLGHVRLITEVRTGTAEATALTASPSAVMDLDEPRWTDRARRAAWVAEQEARGTVFPPLPSGSARDEHLDLDDPVSVCTADPWQVSVRYERSEDGHGGLRGAWLRAGASLTREQEASQRAVVLSAALGDDADPRLSQALTCLADGAAWRVVWRRVRGDVVPPWPGPARALAAGRGPLDGRLLVADHQGTVRVLRCDDAMAVGRLPVALPGSGTVVAHPDGTVTALDPHGRLLTQRGGPDVGAKGLSALLDTGPTPRERLLEAAETQMRGVTATALAAGDGLLAAGDTAGTVHALTSPDDTPRTATLHRGPVTALAATDLALGDDGGSIPIVYSGGADGSVRAWAPYGAPLESPVLSRSCPVTALAVAEDETGPVLAAAWADGLVEHQILGDETTVRTFRPGIHVNALALTPTGHLVVGTDETLACLAPM